MSKNIVSQDFGFFAPKDSVFSRYLGANVHIAMGIMIIRKNFSTEKIIILWDKIFFSSMEAFCLVVLPQKDEKWDL